MPMGELLLSGVELMLLGMGIVFGFLIILVFALKGMSRLALRLEGPTATQPAMPARAEPLADTDDDLIAVIGAAIARYRADHPN